MEKRTTIVIVCIALFAAAVGASLWLMHRSQEPSQEPEQTQTETDEVEGEELENEHMTNVVVYFEGEMPPADPLMVGRWKNAEQAGWHKVYYDDDDGEGHYWGKEWDESEDVLEEDLGYHGNGWFRWTKNNDTLVEYSTMDFRDVPIAHIYLLTVTDSMNIAMAESNGRSVYNFTKE